MPPCTSATRESQVHVGTTSTTDAYPWFTPWKPAPGWTTSSR